jgi:hypothetical protein
VTKSPTGRFSIAVKTNVHSTPWYRLEFKKATSSVDEEIVSSEHLIDDLRTADRVIMTDLLGSVVVDAQGQSAAADVAGLAHGVYVVRVEKEGSIRTLKLLR